MGGQELRILQESAWLHSHGHQVWIAARPDSKIFHAAQERGLGVVPISFRGSVNLKAIGNLIRFCLKHHIQIIDCHSSRDASAVMFLKLLLNAPVIRSLHICKRLRDDFFRRIVWKLGAHGFIASSESLRQRLLDQQLAPAEKINLVGESVNMQIFHPNVSPGTVRADFGIPAEAKVITVVGMIRSNKGQQYLVQALDRIVEQCPDAWIMLVGAATEAKFQKAIDACLEKVKNRNRVVLTGFQTGVERFIAASDVICLPSQAEAQSKIIPEAFAMKKPVVASNVGGIPELLKDGVNGTLFPVGNVEALAAAIIKTLNSDVSAMVEKAYLLAVDTLCFERQMAKTLAVYRKIARLD